MSMSQVNVPGQQESQLDFASLQADGPQILVKNTFISVEQPPVPDLQRAKTAPGPNVASIREDPSSGIARASSTPASISEVPGPEPLDRLRTEERWEHCDG